jgi:hypothetical protein
MTAGAGELDSIVDDGDRQFLLSVQTVMWAAGVTLLVLGIASWRVPSIGRRFCTLRPYAGAGIAGAAFVLASPFLVVSPQDFLYGVGAELKANMIEGDGPQWLAYFHRYARWESLTALAGFAAGCVALVGRRVPDSRSAHLLGAYVLLSYLAIGSSGRGYERYLTPVLPVIFVVSAWGVWSLADTARRYPRSGVAALMIFAGFAGYELYPKLREVLDGATTRDLSHAAFAAVVQRRPASVLYSGSAVPAVEWKLEGLNVLEVPRASLREHGAGVRPLLTPGTVLAIDGIAEQGLGPAIRNLLTPIRLAGGDGVPAYDRVYLYQRK